MTPRVDETLNISVVLAGLDDADVRLLLQTADGLVLVSGGRRRRSVSVIGLSS